MIYHVTVNGYALASFLHREDAEDFVAKVNSDNLHNGTAVLEVEE